MQQPIDLVFPGQMEDSTKRPWGRLNGTGQGTTTSPGRLVDEARAKICKSLGPKPAKPITIDPRTEIYPIRVQIGSQSIHHGLSSSSPFSTKESGGRTPSSRKGSMLPPTETYGLPPSQPRIYSGSPSSGSSGITHSVTGTTDGGKWLAPQDDAFEDLKRHVLANKGSEHVVYASSAIQEPVPQRTDISSILRRSPSIKSADVRSVRAEIGRRKRQAPSEVADNEQWLYHLVSSDDLVIPLTRGSSLLDSPFLKPCISPGISEILSSVETLDVGKHKGSEVLDCSSLVLEGNMKSEEKPPVCAVVALISEVQRKTPSAPEAILPDWGRNERDRASGAKNTAALVGRAQEQGGNIYPSSGKPTSPAQARNKLPKYDLFTIPADDDNATWMKLLFGEDESSMLGGFQQAAHDAAKEIRPSDSSVSSDEPIMQNRSTEDSGDADSCIANPSTSSEECSDTIVSSGCANTSHVSTRGSNLSPEIHTVNIAKARDVVGVLTSASSVSEASVLRLNPILPRDINTLDPKSDMATDGSPVIAETAQPIFRFVAPATFVGKFASSAAKPQGMLPPALPPVVGEKGGKGRRKRAKLGRGSNRGNMAANGRADIRALPDFEDDPIEESDG